MTWDPTWEKVFVERPWGKYPPEELIRFIARNFHAVPDRSRVRVLEIGCGPGANVWYLSREGFAVTAVDGSAAAISQARRRLDAEGLRAELHVADIMALMSMFSAASFDAVIDVECLSCNRLGSVHEMIHSIYAVLKPGGRFFSKMFSRGTYGDGLGQEIEPGTFVEISAGPLAGIGLNHLFSLEEIEACFTGFADLKVELSSRSLDGRRHWVKEWVVEAKKPDVS